MKPYTVGVIRKYVKSSSGMWSVRSQCWHRSTNTSYTDLYRSQKKSLRQKLKKEVKKQYEEYQKHEKPLYCYCDNDSNRHGGA